MVNQTEIPKEAHEDINKFCVDFYMKYKMFPFISFKTVQGKRETLSMAYVEFVVNQLLQQATNDLSLNVKLKRRYKPLIAYRHCMFKILYEMGYSLSTMGRYFKFNHASILHGKNEVLKYLDLKDDLVVRINSEITNELENQKSRNVDFIQYNDGAESNT